MNDARVVLITGGGGGMGRAIAARFLEAGAKVAVSDLDPKRVESISRELGAHGIQGDVTKVADCERMVQETVAKFGRLDVLVAAAGIWTEGASDEATEAEWDKVIDVNLKGVFFTNRYAIPELEKTKGIIVNIASDAGLVGNAGAAIYCASKGGLVHLTRELAAQWGRHGVRVNGIAPGLFVTEMTAHLLEESPEMFEGPLSTVPLKRPGVQEEMDAAVMFLLSPASSYVTGQVLAVDGGYTA